MATQLKATASITGGSLKLFLYKTDGQKLIGQITDNGSLDISLEDATKYFVTYQVVSHTEGCKYSVQITSPPTAVCNISLTLHKDARDFNSIPFHT